MRGLEHALGKNVHEETYIYMTLKMLYTFNIAKRMFFQILKNKFKYVYWHPWTLTCLISILINILNDPIWEFNFHNVFGSFYPCIVDRSSILDHQNMVK